VSNDLAVSCSASLLPERESRVSALQKLAGAAVAVSGMLALGLTLSSLHWPLVFGAPVMHFIAARILDGAVPYRGLYDMNFPGVYLVHMLGLVLFGPSDAGFRALDLLLLAGTAVGIAVALARFGRWAQAFGVIGFWVYHLAAGPLNAGERDFILCLPLVWMTVAAFAYITRGQPLMLGLAGLGLGTAVCIKPLALLLTPALVALLWRHPAGARVRAACSLALGFTIPAAGVAAWLAATGGLTAFIDVVEHFPWYGRLARAPLSELMEGQRAPRRVAPWALGGLGALKWAGQLDTRGAILAAGVVYGVVHYIVQAKGWEYQLYPAVLFAVMLGAAGLGVALRTDQHLLIVTLLTIFLVNMATFGVKGFQGLEDYRQYWARARAVASALAPILEGGRTVQVLDSGRGGHVGHRVLYLLRARQPTRFIYDFHLFHDVASPWAQKLQGEFMEGLRARPPAAIVLFEKSWPGRSDYERLNQFPALAAWLKSGYRLAHEGEGYRIYEARGDR